MPSVLRPAILLFLACRFALPQSSSAPPSPTQIRSLAEQTYAFAYPIVLMEFTRRATVSGDLANRFIHLPEFPTDTSRRVIRPNADTLYSSAWLDLSKEPMMLHVPDTGGRVYLMHFMDAWTETFAVPGKRTTGTGERWFAVVGPGWTGSLPDRAERIDAPTNMVWLLGRTQTNNAADYPAVRAIQQGYWLMPLSQYPEPRSSITAKQPNASAVAQPPALVDRLAPLEFFRVFKLLLEHNPPHPADAPFLTELARMGDPEALGPEGRKAFEEGLAAGAAHVSQLAGAFSKPGRTGWTGWGSVTGRYAADYGARAAVAKMGLAALPPEDAVYLSCRQDGDGKPLDGTHRYGLHFSKNGLPPARAFWSVTLYGPDGYFVKNPIQRFAIGDRDPLKFNEDGSLDLVIQRDAPGGDKDRNWLPTPEGGFNLTLRIYWPKDEALQGRWIPPAVSLLH